MKKQLMFAQLLRCWILIWKLMLAVIDEVQMLEDPDRGWAWVNAIIGVPAKKSYYDWKCKCS